MCRDRITLRWIIFREVVIHGVDETASNLAVDRAACGSPCRRSPDDLLKAKQTYKTKHRGDYENDAQEPILHKTGS